MKRNNFQGFTLLELLVAIAVFSIMATMAYGGLRSVMAGREHTDQVAQRLRELQRTLLFLQQDLSQIVARPVRDEYGEVESAVIAGGAEDEVLQLTRGGVGRIGRDRPSLRRVSYQLKGSQLIRRVWPTLDRVQGSEPRQFYLASTLERIEFRFLSDKASADWMSSWPPLGETTAKSVVPRAVEVTLQVTGIGAITRLFLVGT